MNQTKNSKKLAEQESISYEASTPDCNTGVENASEHVDAQTNDYKPVSQALVDYLRFTVRPPEDGSETEDEIVQRYMNLLGGEESWDVRPYGLYRYRKGARLEGFYIAWDGAEIGMGVCVQISGQGCRQLERLGIVDVRTLEYEHKGTMRKYSLDGWPKFMRSLRHEARIHFTRIDVAFDDADERLHIDNMRLAILDGRLVSQFRDCRPHGKVKIATGEEDLTTLYFGSRSSDVMVRAYNKAAQQKMDSCHWVRVEIEARDDRAESMVDRIIEEGAAAAAGVLARYIDFKERGECLQRCRWDTCAWWSEFLEWACKVRLCGLAAAQTIESVRRWLFGQVAPMLAVVFRAAGSRLKTLMDLVYDGEKRFRRRHVQLLGEGYAASVLADNEPTPI